jgi:hypothetical protein
MSAIAAKILGRDHDHVYHEVHQRHRLSYADLDALLDREERDLHAERERQRQLGHHEKKLVDPTTSTTLETKVFIDHHHAHTSAHPKGTTSTSSSSSSSSSSDDEADWHAGGEHEDDLLLELEETTQESIHTVAGAEDHLVKDIDTIVYVVCCRR